jgi:hypothetical protein
MQAEETVLDRIEIRKLKWYGHLMRMSQDRWQVKIHARIPPGRRQKGQCRWSWQDGVTEAIEKRVGWLQKTYWNRYFGNPWQLECQ